MMTARKPFSRKVWGGFIGGRLDTNVADYGYGNKSIQLAIFKGRKEARQMYEDVRPLELREWPKGKKP